MPGRRARCPDACSRGNRDNGYADASRYHLRWRIPHRRNERTGTTPAHGCVAFLPATTRLDRFYRFRPGFLQREVRCPDEDD